MSAHTHTPGPWEACDDHPQHACYHIRQVGRKYAGDEVATVYSPRDPEATANARLIAAAPELLDALRQWQAAERDGDAAELANARTSRDAAIAKARGEA